MVWIFLAFAAGVAADRYSGRLIEWAKVKGWL